MNNVALETTHNLEERSQKLEGYFSNTQWAFYCLAILIGVVVRWYALGDKPMHHDESLHAMYGKYIYDWPNIQFYKYDPMLHGPVLYNLIALLYMSFGVSETVARLPVAFLGSLFLFMPLIFRKFFKPYGVLGLTWAVSLSPVLVYYSRFIIHDFLVITALLMVLWGVTMAKPKNRAFYVLIAFTLQYCIKANVFVTAALLLGYLFVECAFVFLSDSQEESLGLRVGRYLARYWAYVSLAFLLSALLFCYFYSAGFRYSEGILDGLYRKVFPYWIGQHKQQRIAGPFAFNFYFLTWYELPFILAMFLQTWLFYLKTDRRIRFAGIVGFAVIVATVGYHLSVSALVKDNPIWKYFKLENTFDVFWFLFLMLHAVLVTFGHLFQREKVLAFTGYFFFGSFWTYSYLGEKVPWLGMYPLVAGMIYLALFFEDYFTRFPIANFKEFRVRHVLIILGLALALVGVIFGVEQFLWSIFGNLSREEIDQMSYRTEISFVLWGFLFVVVGAIDLIGDFLDTVNLRTLIFAVLAIYTFRAMFLTNFVFGGDSREYISQVHTTWEFQNILKNIREEITANTENSKPMVLVEGEPVWPATWYLRDLPEYKFSAKPEEWGNFDYIFQTWEENPKNVPPGFDVRKITLRGWWVPDFNRFTLKRFLNYSVNHQPWSDVGYSYATYLVNPRRKGRGEKLPNQP